MQHHPPSEPAAISLNLEDGLVLQRSHLVAAVAIGCLAASLAYLAVDGVTGRPAANLSIDRIALLAFTAALFIGALALLRTKTLRFGRPGVLISTRLFGVPLTETLIPMEDIRAVFIDERGGGRGSTAHFLCISTNLKTHVLARANGRIRGTLLANEIVDRIEARRG